MFRRLPTALVAIALILAGPASAVAQMNCGPRGQVVQQLGQSFGEIPAAVALTDYGSLIELLLSPRGESWTLIVTTPRGLACVLATGRNWQALDHNRNEPAA